MQGGHPTITTPGKQPGQGKMPTSIPAAESDEQEEPAEPFDIVELAGKESFPASDAPCWTP